MTSVQKKEEPPAHVMMSIINLNLNLIESTIYSNELKRSGFGNFLSCDQIAIKEARNLVYLSRFIQRNIAGNNRRIIDSVPFCRRREGGISTAGVW